MKFNKSGQRSCKKTKQTKKQQHTNTNKQTNKNNLDDI